jgi:hypothetical protein
MALVSLEAQEALRADLEATTRRFPANRPADWRGAGARGGRKLSPPSAIVAGEPSSVPPQVQSIAPPPEQSQGLTGESEVAGTYWDAITRLGGQRLASDVQGKLVRFVKDLTVEEIELIAKKDNAMATSL